MFRWLFARRKPQRAVIFDFDGTVADSFPLAVDIFYKMMKRKPLPRADVSRLRGMALHQVARELKIPLHRLPWLVIRGRRAMRRRMSEVGIVPGVEVVIKRLAKSHKLFILSSNSPDTIRAVLTHNKLLEYFTAVEGDVSLLGKARRLRQITKQHKLERSKTYYVGDESRDIEAARHAGLKPIAVSWGYNNIHALKHHHPDALVFTPDELLSCIKNN